MDKRDKFLLRGLMVLPFLIIWIVFWIMPVKDEDIRFNQTFQGVIIDKVIDSNCPASGRKILFNNGSEIYINTLNSYEQNIYEFAVKGDSLFKPAKNECVYVYLDTATYHEQRVMKFQFCDSLRDNKE
ncbi:MAG: hypothetical protein MI784_11680 [Cytophagales bacterium]|nr:hypothetical protein [Cytophagales bacterium]